MIKEVSTMRIKNEINYKLLVQLFMFTRQTWSVWKKQERPIVDLVEKYFTDKDLEEFIETGKIQKQDRLNELLEMEKRYNQIVGVINNKTQQNKGV